MTNDDLASREGLQDQRWLVDEEAAHRTGNYVIWWGKKEFHVRMSWQGVRLRIVAHPGRVVIQRRFAAGCEVKDTRSCRTMASQVIER